MVRLRLPGRPKNMDEASGQRPAERLPGQLVFGGEGLVRRPWWRRRRNWVVGAAILILVLLVSAGALAGYVAWTNMVRADDWQARSARLQENVDALDEAVAERTKALNQRTTDLNAMAEKVADAERAIDRSEADVKRLERRQRKLAAEKADVEDARAALALQTAAIEDVASSYISCKNGLSQLLRYVLDENYYAASAIVYRVDADCATAEDALQRYLANYG